MTKQGSKGANVVLSSFLKCELLVHDKTTSRGRHRKRKEKEMKFSYIQPVMGITILIVVIHIVIVRRRTMITRTMDNGQKTKES